MCFFALNKQKTTRTTVETPPTTCARPNSSYAARLNKSLRCDWKAPQFGTNPHLEGKSGRCFWWVSPLPLKRDPWIVWAEKQGVFWCRYTYRYIHVYVYIYLRWYVYSHIYIYTASRISCNQCIDGHITDGHDGLATWSPKSSQGFHSIPSWSVEKSAFE